jgi:hypothetical protein
VARARLKLSRTRYAAARESELDMRCLVRDWQRLRFGRNYVQATLKARSQGALINEVKLERVRANNKRLLKECNRRYERLHRRMDRLRVQANTIADITGSRGDRYGNAAHP